VKLNATSVRKAKFYWFGLALILFGYSPPRQRFVSEAVQWSLDNVFQRNTTL
jgi:hypothetical protein